MESYYLIRQTCITSTPDQNNKTIIPPACHLIQPHCLSYGVINSLNIELNNDTKPGLLIPTAQRERHGLRCENTE